MPVSPKSETLYGAAQLQRYARSLSTNLVRKAHKLRSSDSVYCNYARTNRRTGHIGSDSGELASRADATKQLEGRLTPPGRLDAITFSGNGEPTPHPDSPKLVVDVLPLRGKYKPEAGLALLPNAAGLTRPRVRQVTVSVDWPVLTLDTETLVTFNGVNRPASDTSFDSIVEHLASPEDIHIQTMLMAGYPGCTRHEEPSARSGWLRRIRPKGVRLHPVGRPASGKRTAWAKPDRLMVTAVEPMSVAGARVKVVDRQRRLHGEKPPAR